MQLPNNAPVLFDPLAIVAEGAGRERMDSQEKQDDRLMVVLAELRERTERAIAEAWTVRAESAELRIVATELRDQRPRPDDVMATAQHG
jgi:hypothetical protein